MENPPYRRDYYREPRGNRAPRAHQYTGQQRNFLKKNQAIVAYDQTDGKEEDKDFMKRLEKALSRLQIPSYKIDCPVPVSTRNVGFTVQRLFNNSTAIPHLKEKLPQCTVFQMFRVMLAVVEHKIQQNTDHFINPFCKDYVTKYHFIEREWLSLTDSLRIYPTNIAVIWRLFGKLNYHESTFFPVFSRDYYDKDGKIIPVPETVRFLNLENVVNVLAEKGDANFKNFNPLPGAIWDGDKLQNQYDFWPQNYTKDEFFRDMYSVSSYLSTLGCYYPKWIIKTEPNEKGSAGVFISVERNKMRIENGKVLGDACEFYSSTVLKKNEEIGLGVYGLVGELPSNYNKDTIHLWGRRLRELSSQTINTSFRASWWND